jgi:D-alanine-D-alanine ligase
MGGASLEAEVSRVSANEVAKALAEKAHRVTLVELNENVALELNRQHPDVVFPALHGPPGEDGTVQGMLEMLNLPYVGSNVHGSAVAMDKGVAKTIFRQAGLPVAEDVVVLPGTDPDAAAVEIAERLGERIVVKPASQGSAIGVTRLANGGDPREAVAQALKLGSVLIEPFVMGREITVGVLDLFGQEAVPFPVIEIRTATDEWYDYVNRYKVGGSEHVIPAPLPDAVNAELQRIAVVAHQSLGLRDLSRADFIVADDDAITLLEVNTLPGMTPTSLYPDGARAMEIDFPDLLDALVRSAVERFEHFPD